jgi:hypothetical protein
MKSLPELLREKSPQHHTRYAYIKEIAGSGFQKHATLVGYLTDHGPQHYQNLETNLSLLLPDEVKRQLAVEEIFLLLCAVHFHDIGLLSEKYPDEPWTDVRKDHVNRTYDYLHDFYKDWGLNRFEAAALKNICLGHSGKTLYELPEEAVIHRSRIRVQFLAALLRMADELDLDYTRVSPTILRLKKIPEESLEHWRKHEEIGGVLIDPKSWTIEVHAMPTNEASKAIIEGLVEQKLQQELEYICSVFEKYGLYYRQVIVKYEAFGNKRSSTDQSKQSKQDAHSSDKASQERPATPSQRVREAPQQPLIEKHVPQSAPPSTPSPSAQQDDTDEDASSNLIRDLIRSSPSIFDAVIAYYNPPPGVAETGTKASKVRELVNTAGIKGNLQKLIDAYQLAMSEQPLVKKVQQKLTVGTKQDAEVAEQAMSKKRDAEKRSSEEPFPDTLRGCVEGAQRNVKKAYDLLDPEMNILPEEIENAGQFLKTAKGDIEHLQELLEENSPLPEHGSIIDQIRIITDQINEYLAPPLKPSESLDKIFQKKSSPLLNALNKLDTLILE